MIRITRRLAIIIVLCSVSAPFFSGCLELDSSLSNSRPIVLFQQPTQLEEVLGIVNITGTSYDPDDDAQIRYVEIRIDNSSEWIKTNGKTKWNYQWNTYSYENGEHKIRIRAWDGSQFSKIVTRNVILINPEDIDYDSHKWAVFIAAANFPEDELNKLGNGGLYLAQNMSDFFIEELQYSTSNVYILFDDGWIRNNSGFGEPIEKLENKPHPYNITYGAATKDTVEKTLNKIIVESNKYDDSEIFIWIFNHGFGDYTKKVTGGKLFEESTIFLWDGYLIDSELGVLLEPLESDKTCVLVDACYIGGFADKTIYNIPTSPILRSGVPQPGRVILTSTSKFRTGIAIIEYGPLFTLLWFDGLITGNADGFRQGFLKTGRLPRVLIQDDKVSVEEAFYYARYLLRTVDGINEFKTMQPQINDQYPSKGIIRNRDGLILGD